MRAVVQRVSRASVRVEGELVSEIGRGLLVYAAAGVGDTEKDALQIAEKIAGLRIFPDETRSMNRSLLEVGGAVLVVSQFTLYGDCRRGKRPSFIDALEPVQAESLLEALVAALGERGLRAATGRFRAMMDVESVNDGPVTILLDSRKLF
jgi:D-tyrosyl-tRNA(Tyr) deacylase